MPALSGLAVVAFLIGCGSPGSVLLPQDAEFSRGNSHASKIVTLAPNTDPYAVAAEYGVSPDFVYTTALVGFSGKVSDLAHSGMLRDYRIVSVENDGPMQAHEVGSWGLDWVDQRALPLDGAYTYPATGQGVTAYIIDSGIRFEHTEFGGRAVPGFDAIKDGRNGADCHGHGTHVAGTVGGTSYGVAKAVRLVSVRVLPCSGSGTVSGLIAGIDWVAKNHSKPAVANISVGASKSNTLNNAVQKLAAAGVLASVSAGNNGADACQISPGSAPDVLTVGATTPVDRRASYSNWGDCVDLFAPGSGIRSAAHNSPTGATNKNGTSMAAPHVAGVMAMMLEQYPFLTATQLHDGVVEMSTAGIVKRSKTTAGNRLLFNVSSGVFGPADPPCTAKKKRNC